MKEKDYGYNVVRFVAITMICLWHFFTTCKENSIVLHQNIDKVFSRGPVNFGGVGVGLFFILSGALMIRGYREQISIFEFYKKRLVRICIPNAIGFFVALCATYVISFDIVNRDKIGMLISALGLNFFNPWGYVGISCVWLIGEWFTTVIIAIYLLFPLLRRLFLSHKLIGSAILIPIFILNMKYKILSNPGGWGSYSNGIMYFWVGMCFEEFKTFFKCKYALVIACLYMLIYLLFPFSFHNEFDYIFVFLFSIMMFILMYQFKIKAKIIERICDLNYEIYLVHHRIYIILLPALIRIPNPRSDQVIICFFILLWITVLVARSLRDCSKIVISRMAVN